DNHTDPWLLFNRYPYHRDLHSFPTRRSSDLAGGDVSPPVGHVAQGPQGRSARAQPAAGDARGGAARQHVRSEPLLSGRRDGPDRSEEHTSELQSRFDLVCRLLLEKKKHLNET